VAAQSFHDNADPDNEVNWVDENSSVMDDLIPR
jgi:hypothetical protein